MYLVVCVQIIFRYPSSYKMDKNSVWICVLSKYVLAVNLSLSLRYISTLPVFLHWCSSRICCFDNRSIICWVLFFITKISLFFRIYYILEYCYLEIDSSCICKVSLFSFFFFFENLSFTHWMLFLSLVWLALVLKYSYLKNFKISWNGNIYDLFIFWNICYKLASISGFWIQNIITEDYCQISCSGFLSRSSHCDLELPGSNRKRTLHKWR